MPPVWEVAQQLDEALDEIGRLRNALEQIANRETSGGMFCNFCSAEDVAKNALDRALRDRAKAAAYRSLERE